MFLFSLLLLPLLITACALAATAQDDSNDQAIAIFNRGQDFHEKGDIKGAIAEYDRALKILPAFPEAEYQRALAEISLHDLDEAEASLRRAVQSRPDWSLAWGMLGDVLVRKYSNAPDPDRAVIASDANAALSRAIELDAANVPAYAALVDLQLNCNVDPAKLRETLTKVKSLTDGKASPAASMWTARSALERRLGDEAAAKASIARALTFDPKNAAAMFAAASFAIDGGDIGRAKAIWAELATQKSVDPDALNLLNANIAAAEGAFDEALKLLGEIKQPTAQAVELKAKITTARSQDPADLEKQLAADLKNAAVLGRLCAMYRRSDPARALDYCRRASESEPNNIQHAVGFAAALVQAKQFGQAVVLLQRLIALAPGNATLHANLATALFELKRYSEARTEFDWLVADQPSAAAPYFFLGIIHDRSTEFVDSLAAYEQYLKLADPVANKDEIDKVNLRLPALRTLVKKAKGKKSGS